MSTVATVLYYDKRVKYSLNPLIASIDLIKGNDVYLVEDRNVLFRVIDYVSNKYSKCIVGFSLLTTFLTDSDFLNLILEVNKYAHMKKCITIVGGPHATGDPVGCIESLGFDYVFIGEGEESVREFIESLVDNLDPLSVKGIVFKFDDERIQYTGFRKPVNLDEYHPFPYWRYLFNPVEITRGCVYGCKYCQVSYLHGFSMRHRSVEKIVYYVKLMIDGGIRDIRFISPNSLSYGSSTPGRVNYSSIDELLSKLYVLASKYGARIFFGTFPSEVRPDYIDDDVLKIIKKYVCNREIIIGAQSGSDRLLREISRKHSVEDVLNAVELIIKHGFKPIVDFIIGLPGETLDDLVDTLNVIEKLVSQGSRIRLHSFIPLPGTPLGYVKPSEIPEWFKQRVIKYIGMGKVYGEWIKQEELSRKIIKLREKGIIKPFQFSTLYSQ